MEELHFHMENVTHTLENVRKPIIFDERFVWKFWHARKNNSILSTEDALEKS